MKFYYVAVLLINLLGAIDVWAMDCEIDVTKTRKRLATSLEYIHYVVSNHLSGHDLTNTYYTASVCYALLDKYDSAIYYLPKDHTSLVNLDDIFYEECQTTHSWKKAAELIVADFKSRYSNLKNLDLAMDLTRLSGREQSVMWYGFYLQKGSSCDKLKLAHQQLHKKVKLILESLKGKDYPTVNDIGAEGMKSLFLLIQHSDDNVALQKLFKSKMEAVLKKQSYTDTLLITQLAFLTDRVLVNENKPQEYGTQFDESHHLLPIRDAINVNTRRSLVFLAPLK